MRQQRDDKTPSVPAPFTAADPSLKSAGFASRGSPCPLNLIRRYSLKGVKRVLHLTSTVFSGAGWVRLLVPLTPALAPPGLKSPILKDFY